MKHLNVAANIVCPSPVAPAQDQKSSSEAWVAKSRERISSVDVGRESKCCRAHEQSRRAALCLLGAVSLSVVKCDDASAFSPGFSGMKDWLKGQKQKTSQFLLTPIDASRDRLKTALLLLSEGDLSKEGIEEAGRLVKVASRDCMPAEDGSIIGFQSRTGVEVCTFRLVLKNASSLLADTDPVKVKAEEDLQALIRSFVILDGLLATDSTGESVDRDSLTGALKETSLALEQFDAGVRACLGIA
ncbi:hypothetical protein MPTK1_3g23410 [Marchantia polymorpha subsp. ruderalis]|uniref:Uncharacterized protein n=2 Tax=Marchantia polymorpha TaxID=3197 RepID=A0AAF6B3Y9_MARPO|nr:hypothetical protein MARPO_0024s0117 [Marchantia polymorpha]BBN06723.1 hypothetical protein Mp_3g23410 [Marchantia polymorpha subsp. ruderalis]|eukprot:PTQ43621.1 hypothetical protein MARPO_0024s0117 [Marchantia polymorpha]